MGKCYTVLEDKSDESSVITDRNNKPLMMSASEVVKYFQIKENTNPNVKNLSKLFYNSRTDKLTLIKEKDDAADDSTVYAEPARNGKNGSLLTRKVYIRQSTFTKGNSTESNVNMQKGAAVGNHYDLIGRMFFNNPHITYNEYKAKKPTDSDFVVNISPADFEAIKANLTSLRNTLSGKGYTVILSDEVVVHADYKTAEGADARKQKKTGVAGTADLIVVNPITGAVAIVDFKTVTLNKGTLEDKIKSKTEDWSAQQTVYQELYNRNGVAISEMFIAPLFHNSTSISDTSSGKVTIKFSLTEKQQLLTKLDVSDELVEKCKDKLKTIVSKKEASDNKTIENFKKKLDTFIAKIGNISVDNFNALLLEVEKVPGGWDMIKDSYVPAVINHLTPKPGSKIADNYIDARKVYVNTLLANKNLKEHVGLKALLETLEDYKAPSGPPVKAPATKKGKTKVDPNDAADKKTSSDKADIAAREKAADYFKELYEEEDYADIEDFIASADVNTFMKEDGFKKIYDVNDFISTLTNAENIDDLINLLKKGPSSSTTSAPASATSASFTNPPNQAGADMFSVVKTKPTEIANINEEITWLNKVLPNVPVDRQEGLLTLANGNYVEGSYFNGAIILRDGARRGIAYHEALHAVLDMYLTPNEVESLYREVGWDGSEYTYETSPEEALAELMREYMIDAERITKKYGFLGKVFLWVKDFINAVLSPVIGDKYTIFARIRQGKYAHMKYQVKGSRTSYSIVSYKDLSSLMSKAARMGDLVITNDDITGNCKHL